MPVHKNPLSQLTVRADQESLKFHTDSDPSLHKSNETSAIAFNFNHINNLSPQKFY